MLKRFRYHIVVFFSVIGPGFITAATSDVLTNKTISAASNTISGLTTSNLSATANIANTQLASSSLTISAGTGLLGGGLVSLGGTVSLSLPQAVSTTSAVLIGKTSSITGGTAS